MALRMNTPLPPLEGATEWVNGDEVSVEDLAGKPVLIHFWAISCGICKKVMPQTIEYRDKYAEAGLQVIGVHMPRSEADTDVDAVKQAIEELNLTHPQAIDNQHELTDAFENQFVPAFYLFDAAGEMKFRTAGDRGVAMLESRLEKLMGDSSKP